MENLHYPFLIESITDVRGAKLLKDTYAKHTGSLTHNKFILVKEGHITLKTHLDGVNTFDLQAGEYIIQKPCDMYEIFVENSEEFSICEFVDFSCKGEAIEAFYNKTFRFPEHLQHLINLILNQKYDTLAIGGFQLIKIYMEQLLIFLARNEFNNDPQIRKLAKSHLISLILKYLEDSVWDKLSLDKLASDLNYSKVYICKVFKEYTNCTVADHYNSLKILKAKSLIESEKYNFTEIARVLNFSDPQHFRLMFKKKTGQTPRQYKQSLR